MPKIVHHREVEYDFALHWPRGEDCPFKNLDDEIPSGTIDGDGRILHFVGKAWPVEMESGTDGTTIYLKIYEAIGSG